MSAIGTWCKLCRQRVPIGGVFCPCGYTWRGLSAEEASSSTHQGSPGAEEGSKAASAQIGIFADLNANPWASCGPVALAALLGCPLTDIRHAFPAQREGQTWTNVTAMRLALNALRVPWHRTGFGPTIAERAWPRRGLALIQFEGSWSSMPINHPAQLHRTHWIACASRSDRIGDEQCAADTVFDVNAVGDESLVAFGYWQSRIDWERVMAPWLAKNYGKKATGLWWVREGIEVSG